MATQIFADDTDQSLKAELGTDPVTARIDAFYPCHPRHSAVKLF